MPDPMGEPARLSAHRPRLPASQAGSQAPPEASAPGSEPLPDQCLRGATSARLSHRKLARPGGSLSPAPCGAAPPTPGRGTSELARPREGASRPVAPGLGRGADVVTANAGPSSCVGVASNLGLQCRNNRQAQKTNVVGTHDTGIALMSDAAPCAGDTGRRLRGPCSAGQGPDANAKGSASSRPHPGAHGQQGSAGDKFPPTSWGTSSLTLPWARSYSANSEPLPQAARLYLTWPPPRRSVPASPTLPRARTAIAVHLFVPLERRAPRRQDGVLL